LCDWRSRLADPEKQWKRGYSAFEAAIAWEKAAADGTEIPKSILDLLAQQRPELANPKLIVGIVEHKVNLKGGNRPSQNDVWALVKVGSEMFSLAVEAKAGESFADLVSVWLEKKENGSDKPTRLNSLREILGIPGDKDVSDLRYQLLHRTASALVEAERVGAKYAAMIVQSFKNEKRKADPKKQLDDFRKFGEMFGVSADEGQLVRVPNRKGIQLYLGWATCEPATDAEVAKLA
jgi:hypothetical protein